MVDDDLPTKGTEVGEYLLYAIDLIISKKVDIKSPPAIIVFPDRSYFSTRI